VRDDRPDRGEVQLDDHSVQRRHVDVVRIVDEEIAVAVDQVCRDHHNVAEGSAIFVRGAGTDVAADTGAAARFVRRAEIEVAAGRIGRVENDSGVPPPGRMGFVP
jgi:hypothetical protein